MDQLGVQPHFYGLLYVDEARRHNENIKGGGDPVDIYIRCAALCAKSVEHHGYKFRLITNNTEFVQKRLDLWKLPQIELYQHRFVLSVPDQLKFWAAHFKLELYQLFGSGELGAYVGLIDIDSVMVRPLTIPAIGNTTIIAYDVTNQIVAEFGVERVRGDLEKVSGIDLTECRWFGGEFLLGPAQGFHRLAAAVAKLWPRYMRHSLDLHHISDEVLLSAGLPTAELAILDGGTMGLVARWWTARTRFDQLTFREIEKRSILHLPADKVYLSEYAGERFVPEVFIETYKKAAGGKLLRRRLFNNLATLLGQERKYVGRL